MSDLKIKTTYGLFDNPLNNRLISDLKKKGEDVMVFPSIKTVGTELSENAAILKNLTDFDWLIFSDIFAVDYFIEALRELGIDFFELDNLTVCALGEAVADRLRFVQAHADVIPSKLSGDAVFSAISNYAGFELKDLRFLILREATNGLSLVEMLRSENALTQEIAIYKAFFEDESVNIKQKTLLKGGAVDEFIFSSPEDLLSLKFLSPETDLIVLLSETKVSAVSEIVFQTLQENNLRPLYFHSR